ncbi:MAG TPA: hypothetical protein VD887_06395 [Allosphingosinicella sp.]|nr:hypothetical protein [Allosphingosinicella sp.]
MNRPLPLPLPERIEEFAQWRQDMERLEALHAAEQLRRQSERLFLWGLLAVVAAAFAAGSLLEKAGADRAVERLLGQLTPIAQIVGVAVLLLGLAIEAVDLRRRRTALMERSRWADKQHAAEDIARLETRESE